MRGGGENQARFTCMGCGRTDHAHTNAAITIERRPNTSLLDVEGGIGSPMKRQLDETSWSPKIPAHQGGEDVKRTRIHMSENSYPEVHDFVSAPSTCYEGGYEIKERWSEEIGGDSGSTKTVLLGHELWDAGRMVRFVPWEGEERAQFADSAGGEEPGDDSPPMTLWERITKAYRVLRGR